MNIFNANRQSSIMKGELYILFSLVLLTTFVAVACRREINKNDLSFRFPDTIDLLNRKVVYVIKIDLATIIEQKKGQDLLEMLKSQDFLIVQTNDGSPNDKVSAHPIYKPINGIDFVSTDTFYVKPENNDFQIKKVKLITRNGRANLTIPLQKSPNEFLVNAPLPEKIASIPFSTPTSSITTKVLYVIPIPSGARSADFGYDSDDFSPSAIRFVPSQ